MAAAGGRRPGRPAHEPAPEQREQVAKLASEGKAPAAIAVEMDLSEPTIRLHYAYELEHFRPQMAFGFAADDMGKSPHGPTERSGRPPHKASDKRRREVEILIAGGMRSYEIARYLGISEPTLRLHYAAELEAGRAKKKGEMMIAQFKTGLKGNAAAQREWLKRPVDVDSWLDEAPQQPAEKSAQGKKAQAAEAARTAGEGTEWGDDLRFPKAKMN